MDQFKIRDKRNKGWFYMDNEYLTSYAKIFGPVATAVYVCLCRHADNTTQKCFPSQRLIAEEINVVETTVKKYLKLFEKYKLIHIERGYNVERKIKLNNVYYLLDKSEWEKPEAFNAPGTFTRRPTPSLEASNSKSHRQEVANKDTHLNNTHIISAEPSSATRFSLEEEIQKLKSNKKRHFIIVGVYLEYTKPDVHNYVEFQALINELEVNAIKIADFSTSKIQEAMNHLKQNSLSKWTLETVLKYLTK